MANKDLRVKATVTHTDTHRGPWCQGGEKRHGLIWERGAGSATATQSSKTCHLFIYSITVREDGKEVPARVGEATVVWLSGNTPLTRSACLGAQALAECETREASVVGGGKIWTCRCCGEGLFEAKPCHFCFRATKQKAPLHQKLVLMFMACTSFQGHKDANECNKWPFRE